MRCALTLIAITSVSSSYADPAPSSNDHALPDGPIAGLDGFALRRVVDAKHCGGFSIELTRKPKTKVLAEAAPLVALLEVSALTGLDFDPTNSATRQKSMKRFESWIANLAKLSTTAGAFYADAIEKNASSFATMARMVQVNRALVGKLVHFEIPRDVRTGEFAADKIAAFCDALNDKAEPVVKRADELAARCAELAKDHAGWWTAVCVTSSSGAAPSP
jgi:hypothetical protein